MGLPAIPLSPSLPEWLLTAAAAANNNAELAEVVELFAEIIGTISE